MAEVGYNSKFEGREVDSRLENVVQAAPGTGSESGKGGLIPAPPAGSQDECALLDYRVPQCRF